MPQFIALVRGLAMFDRRRVSKVRQIELLRRHLPATIQFIGAFDDSGNYALESQGEPQEVSTGVLEALRRDGGLADLRGVSVARVETVRRAFEELVLRLRDEYGSDWNEKTYGVRRGGTVWRAGFALLPESETLEPLEWPRGREPRVIILSVSAGVAMFLKRENAQGDTRISFGDPTRAFDRALRALLGRDIATTSRSARTVAGLLRCFSAQRE